MKQPSADQPREDDGYFDPDSVSWRLFADPSSRLGGLVALMLHALNPAMIRLFDRTSVSADYDAGRDERTGRYIQTTIFGDKAHADAAAETVRAMHARAKWTDPRTGEVLEADRPEYLEWTHNSLVWGVLRAADAFGPELSTADQDRFVVEQHKSGEWMGIDPVRLPTTRAALDAYIEEQSDWMALTLPAARAGRGLRKPLFRGNPVHAAIGIIVQDGVLSLLPDWALLLHGIEGRPMNLRGAQKTTRWLIAQARKRESAREAIENATRQTDAHPYRKVRTRS